jgi:hypothetical protein
VDLTGYTLVFVALLAVYDAYAFWARVDPRYPIYGALGLILVGAAASQENAPGTAQVLGIFGFLALLAGVVGVLLAPRRRPRPAEPPAAPAEPVHQGQGSPDPGLDHPDEHPIAVVDGPAGPDD